MHLTIRSSALLVAVGAAAAIGAAFYFQFALGYQPCQLCLWQRWAYYLGIPLAALVAAAPQLARRELLFLLALIFAANAVLGAYHAGVEWALWEGPSSCGAGAGFDAGGNLLEGLQRTRIVPCNAAPWRFLGLSFAGWNMVISAGLAAVALIGAVRRR